MADIRRFPGYIHEDEWRATGTDPAALSDRELEAEIEWTYLIEKYGLEED